MSSRFDLITQQLLQKSFSDCTVSELQHLIQQHPYLAPAQFLLAKKLQEEGTAQATAQFQKAALYHHQPAAFNAFLNSDFPEEDFYQDEPGEEDGEDEPLNFSVDLPRVSQPVQEAAVPPLKKEEKEPETAQATEVEIKESSPAEPAGPAHQVLEVPAFEPYHTIDYFASQGIRLTQEEATKDKMGKQLKSFTQWLKTMKRLPASEQLSGLDPHAEQKVENMAAHSVEESEVLTEAMAEVWIKQGAWEKAAEVYHKLSLAFPHKRIYFAGKLESLKKKV